MAPVRPDRPTSRERAFLAWVALSVLGVVVAQGLVRGLTKLAGSAASVPVAVALAVPLAALVAARRSRVQGLFPASVDGAWRRRRALSALWAVLGVLAVARAVGLSAFMVDPALGWGSTFPPDELAREHQCLPTYLHAGELSRRGVQDVYDPMHWPLTAGVEPGVSSDVRGMGPLVDDPFLYPPPFLLLPRAALLLSHDYALLRTEVFTLNALLCLGAALALARWIGGARGLAAGLLVPALWISVPTGLDLQFGQFHLAAFALSVLAMLAFEGRRPIAGGALLSLAAGCKVFPGILWVHLLCARRWREAAWTAAWGVVWVAATAAVVGWGTFQVFLTEHLPRLVSGELVSFFEDDPRTVAENGSLYGLVFKLRELGVPGATRALASVLSGLLPLLAVTLAWRAARRDTDRAGRAVAWLALLNLMALRSPYLPAAYGYSSALWLLALVAGGARGAAAVAGVAVAWALLDGLPPLPSITLHVALSTVAPLCLLGLCVAPLVRRRAAPPEEDAARAASTGSGSPRV